MNEPASSVPPVEDPSPKQMFSNSLMKKAGMIFLVFVLLQIPLIMITGVMEERQTYNVKYPQDYQGPGARQQTITGPVLTVPYSVQITEAKQVATTEAGKSKQTTVSTEKPTRTQTHFLYFFPEKLSVDGDLVPEIRDEGKFKSILYATALEFKGTFDTAGFAQRKIDDKDLMWHDAFITLGVSDLRGIRKETTLNWNGQHYKFVPGVNGLKLLDSGQHVLLTGMRSGTYPFNFILYLNGSRDLNIFPAGKENKVTLSSSWKDPTFTGGFLPAEKTVTRGGFEALWEVSYISRNLPQLWTDKDPSIKNSLAQYMVGVTLATPVEFYRTAIRAVKYGSLFIIMTFLTFFIVEMVTRLRIHEVQYLLVGLALCLFFLLLIAISEWVPFVWAYILASVSTIAQITLYTQAFSKAKGRNLWQVMAALLTVLYVYLYVLLQLESFSLLLGAIGLFVALTMVLYVTRNIDWYGEHEVDPREIRSASPSE